MLFKILLLVMAALALTVLVVARRPDVFRIIRSITISAPATRVFSKVNDLRTWEEWSPWARLDPKMSQSYEGPTTGLGAVHIGSGNREIGEGRMTITESIPEKRLGIRLEFLKPFPATHAVVFTFRSNGGDTHVSWEMTGRNNLAAKAAHLIMNIDRKVGGDFERGLSQLKSISEAATTDSAHARGLPEESAAHRGGNSNSTLPFSPTTR